MVIILLCSNILYNMFDCIFMMFYHVMRYIDHFNIFIIVLLCLIMFYYVSQYFLHFIIFDFLKTLFYILLCFTIVILCLIVFVWCFNAFGSDRLLYFTECYAIRSFMEGEWDKKKMWHGTRWPHCAWLHNTTCFRSS